MATCILSIHGGSVGGSEKAAPEMGAVIGGLTTPGIDGWMPRTTARRLRNRHRHACILDDVHAHDDYIASFSAHVPKGWTGADVGRVYLDDRCVWDRWAPGACIAACCFAGDVWDDWIVFDRLVLDGSIRADRYRPQVSVERVRPPTTAEAISVLDGHADRGGSRREVEKVVAHWMRGRRQPALAVAFEKAAGMCRE